MIFLYGPPGVGKSTIGRLLAASLNRPFVDVDVEIARQAGQSIPEIFAAHGESGFRALEQQIIGSLLAGDEKVVALGGGALLAPELCRQVTAVAPVLCLMAPQELLHTRLQAAAATRPLLAADLHSQLTHLLQQRADHYASFAPWLDATDTPAAVAWAAQIRLGRFHVRGMGSGYDVRVQPGGLAQLGNWLRHGRLAGPLALVSDEQVAAHYLAEVTAVLHHSNYAVHPVLMPPGEAHKTMTTVTHFWDAFLTAKLERRSTVMALGGGVVGDLAGFAAATFLRGVPWVGVPTSLLAMVDSSLGGKTGADLPQGKNLVGAFHPPRLVLADPHVLHTLPDVELRNGLAEVVKHGLISDPALFALCGQGWSALVGHWAELVCRAMAVKVAVIQADPYEGGQRAALNLGHTIGHALELASGFRLRHGEAVAIGMVVEAGMAEAIGLAAPGLAQEIAGVLHGVGLATAVPPGLSRHTIIQAVGVDKKRQDGQPTFALPMRIGQVVTGITVPDWPRFLPA